MIVYNDLMTFGALAMFGGFTVMFLLSPTLRRLMRRKRKKNYVQSLQLTS